MTATTPKPFVFVLMPFAGDFDDVYKLGISPACKEAGAYCERVDEQLYSGSILDRIYNQIAKADVIVSDMTGRNSNVFYETGYAHALGKTVILLTQKAEDIPFDLKHFPHIVYGGKIAPLKANLKRTVRYFINHPEKRLLASPDALEYYVNRINIANVPHVELSLRDATTTQKRRDAWQLDLNVHNPGDRTVDVTSMRFGFICPDSFGNRLDDAGEVVHLNSPTEVVHLPNSTIMLMWSWRESGLLPGEWRQQRIFLPYVSPEFIADNRETGRSRPDRRDLTQFKCAARTFTDLGTRELSFVVSIEEMVASEIKARKDRK